MNENIKSYPYIIPPEMNIKLVGVIGKAGSGKDTFITDILDYINKPSVRCSFAAALKEGCSQAFGLDIYDFVGREVKEKINPFWSVSPREIAQFVGTELFRNQIDTLLRNKVYKDFWIKRLYGSLIGVLNFYSDQSADLTNHTVFISDVRFQNEVDFITANNGNLVEIIRPPLQGEDNVVGIPNHESEKMNLDVSASIVNNRYIDIINDKGLAELKTEAIHYASFIDLI